MFFMWVLFVVSCGVIYSILCLSVGNFHFVWRYGLCWGGGSVVGILGKAGVLSSGGLQGWGFMAGGV